jgi:hypothetical protein
MTAFSVLAASWDETIMIPALGIVIRRAMNKIKAFRGDRSRYTGNTRTGKLTPNENRLIERNYEKLRADIRGCHGKM